MAWVRGGGGCALGCAEFCCDDEFRDEKTGEVVTVYSTLERHFNMPKKVDTLEELYELSGIQAPKSDIRV